MKPSSIGGERVRARCEHRFVTLAQTVIECRNCGGSDVALYVSAVAVAIAASALVISAREHGELLRQAHPARVLRSQSRP